MKYILAFIVIVVFVVSYLAATSLEDRRALCKDKGGVVVKTLDGWKCMSSGVIL